MDHAKDDNNGKENVTITINNNQYEVHRGHRSVEELKTLAGIPLPYDINIVIDGKLDPLPDNGGVTIKGGEEFISNPKDGASS